MRTTSLENCPAPRRWRCFSASIAVSVCALMPLGCGGRQPTDTPAIKAAGDQMRAIREQCEQRRRSGELKSVADVERCADSRVTATYQQAGYPYMDLIRFAGAARRAGADAVDQGELTEDDYKRQRLVLRDRLAAEINRRNDHSTASPAIDYQGTLDPLTTSRLIDGLPAFGALHR